MVLRMMPYGTPRRDIKVAASAAKLRPVRTPCHVAQRANLVGRSAGLIFAAAKFALAFAKYSGNISTTTTVSGTTYTVNPIVQPGIPQANTTMVTVTVSWRGGQQRYVTSTILSPLQ